MTTYAAYGLLINSSVPLPELTPVAGNGEVYIRLSQNFSDVPDLHLGTWYLNMDPQKSHLYIENLGKFEIQNGREITVFPAKGADQRQIQLYLQGIVLSLLLHQRGMLVLHASAVAVDGKAVAFAGNQGSGKSSLAAALHLRGHAFITDDVTSLNMGEPSPAVAPGYPSIKLSKESVRSLGIGPEAVSPLEPSIDELRYRVTYGFAQKALPLSRVYLLERDARPEIKSISSQEAFIELLRHSLPTRYRQPGEASHFKKCTRLIRQVPFYRLGLPTSPSRLPEFARLVEEHINL